MVSFADLICDNTLKILFGSILQKVYIVTSPDDFAFISDVIETVIIFNDG